MRHPEEPKRECILADSIASAMHMGVSQIGGPPKSPVDHLKENACRID